RAGITQARVDGALVAIDPPPSLAKSREHTIDLVVHVGPLGRLDRERFERGLAWGDGALRVAPGPPSTDEARETLHSTKRACPDCGASVPELDPRWFSFNTRQGQCERCEGRGDDEPADAEPTAGAARRPCRACGGTRLAPIPRRVR